MKITFKQLFLDDQKDRTNVDWDNEELVKQVLIKDKERRRLVNKLLKNKKTLIASDYYYASMIFQHGNSITHFEKANKLAKISMKLGYKKAKWLYAASLDRLLVKKGKLQKFGTQYYKEYSMMPWKIRPYDPKTTDKQRKEYNVPPISKQLQHINELNQNK